MCGGGGGDKAVREQEAAERARQAAINSNVGQIRGIFADPSREAQYAQLESDTTQLGKRELDRQSGDATRQLAFALARGGQTGGSAEIDEGAKVTRSYNDGLLKISRAAQSAGSRLRAADQDTQNQLIAQAQSGLSVGNANSLALTGMRQNILANRADLPAETLGNAFAGVADVYRSSLDSQAYRRGYEQSGSLYGTYGGGGIQQSQFSYGSGG